MWSASCRASIASPLSTWLSRRGLLPCLSATSGPMWRTKDADTQLDRWPFHISYLLKSSTPDPA